MREKEERHGREDRRVDVYKPVGTLAVDRYRVPTQRAGFRGNPAFVDKVRKTAILAGPNGRVDDNNGRGAAVKDSGE
jgi:hypothetical protein